MRCCPLNGLLDYSSLFVFLIVSTVNTAFPMRPCVATSKVQQRLHQQLWQMMIVLCWSTFTWNVLAFAAGCAR